ncbi:hypothetical protein NTHI1209_00751 [Haemophilus influenzae]|uniref:Uncharacterized protein n=1 Tax=Haemophilus influenzae TaxID=727 RepID=A0A158SWA4_HAEIF|nr:hypothetical protein NTHI1209_00751 [Haemophilus influenzae]
MVILWIYMQKHIPILRKCDQYLIKFNILFSFFTFLLLFVFSYSINRRI